jgi:quinoprotein glucose dehydrogenase
MRDAMRDADGEWGAYHRDLAGTRYSPLADITRANVSSLRVAWTWRPDSGSAAPEYKNESTPLMVEGALYFTTGINRAVVRADPATGRSLWRFELDEKARASIAPRPGSGRGVSTWGSGAARRIYYVTPGFQLVALQASTGKPVTSFGTNGVVDLKPLLGVPLDVNTAAIGSSSPPLVFENTIVIGPALEVGLRPASHRNVPGRIPAIDARTGAMRRRFNTIPQPGEFGNDTWKDSSWAYTGNAGAWAPLSVDAARGLLYLPVENATGDYYGGHRPGNNLFSSTVVCLDVRTGKRKWHYQIVHHDIWDRDVTTAPILTDVRVGGKVVPMLVQLTKQSFAYVLDRTTGVPVWPIVERPVPASDVPGEVASPTQPFPTKPAPFDRQGFALDDLIDFTPALRARAIELVKPFRLGPLLTPGSLSAAADGTKGTLAIPGSLGGANWEHGAMDPETGILYVGSYTNPSVIAMTQNARASDMSYILDRGTVPTVDGLPLLKPPYSRITAIDLHTGDHRWMRPSGDTPAAVRDHPALRGMTIPNTGGTTRPVMAATKTLLFTAEGWGGAPVIHALDKRTGQELWRMTLPGSVSSSPMSFRHAGRQYIAFWIDDARARRPSELIALALP